MKVGVLRIIYRISSSQSELRRKRRQSDVLAYG